MTAPPRPVAGQLRRTPAPNLPRARAPPLPIDSVTAHGLRAVELAGLPHPLQAGVVITIHAEALDENDAGGGHPVRVTGLATSGVDGEALL